MPLKFVIDKLDEVAEPLREHYTKADDGKYQLATAGEHPKVSEFRTSNIALKKQVDELLPLQEKYKDIDPDEYRTLKAKAAAGDAPDIVAVRAELAAEKTARADAQKRADAFLIESSISDGFLKSGGRPEARAFIVAQAAGQFIVENGKLKSTKFSPDRPGEPMSLSEWLTIQTRENAFAFLNSGGGGSTGSKGVGGTGVRELVDPTPQDLGKFASDIASGKIRIRYTS